MSVAVPRRHASHARALPIGGTAATVAFLGALLAGSLVLRTRRLDTGFWIDEALSVGIASHALTEIPEVLRQDGSPPLYYVLLHFWIRLFGSGETATHVLSLIFALLAIPAAYWAARTVFDRRVGWVAAALAAVIPYLTSYGQETRMYSLVALLSIVGTGAFLHAFVFGRRRYVVLFGVVLAVLLYTHYWAFFFAVGAGAALLFVIQQSRERRLEVRDAIVAFGAAALVFAPWIPMFVYHALHTGAPWSKTPSLARLLVAPVALVSSDSAAMALLLAGGVGVAAIIRAGDSPERKAVLATIVFGVAALVSAWISSQIEPAWANRYLGLLLGPLVLLAAAGMARAGRLGAVALALVLVIWVTHTGPEKKSNVQDVAAQIAPTLEPGDTVIATQPDQIPALRYYLGPQLAYATPLGPVRDPRVMDWRNALARLRAARPERTLVPLLDGLPNGRRVVLVRPIVRDADQDAAPWIATIRDRSVEWGRALGQDRRFRRLDAVPRSVLDRVASIEVRAVVYEKTSSAARTTRRG
ncbi:MAG TPA: glycosyltransferase family 39 protein [Gaiellaceae bacterium]|nr:glycosyltransferase family 39 protein [Gaiellaceae bacterium]